MKRHSTLALTQRTVKRGHIKSLFSCRSVAVVGLAVRRRGQVRVPAVRVLRHVDVSRFCLRIRP